MQLQSATAVSCQHCTKALLPSGWSYFAAAKRYLCDLQLVPVAADYRLAIPAVALNAATGIDSPSNRNSPSLVTNTHAVQSREKAHTSVLSRSGHDARAISCLATGGTVPTIGSTRCDLYRRSYLPATECDHGTRRKRQPRAQKRSKHHNR